MESKFIILHSEVFFFIKYVKIRNSMINCKQLRFQVSLITLFSFDDIYFRTAFTLWHCLLRKQTSSEMLFSKDEISWIKDSLLLFCTTAYSTHIKINFHKLFNSIQFWNSCRLRSSYWNRIVHQKIGEKVNTKVL